MAGKRYGDYAGEDRGGAQENIADSPAILQFRIGHVSYLYMEPTYKVWRDKGNNLGIQCLTCTKIFWTGNESTIDVMTGRPCHNCEAIKSQNILKNETEYYLANPEGADHALSQPVQSNESVSVQKTTVHVEEPVSSDMDIVLDQE